MNELKKCPFCGGIAEEPYFMFGGYYVSCSICDSLGAEGRTKEEAIKNWNKRYSENT